uniref:Uncharacterized protein n=1 Tax=Anas platyrhynchos platyrhynchos TaxID=8840 RepID=A0A493SZB2_ANAPP
MSEQGYVVAPPYSQSQPRVGDFSKSFGPPNSSLWYGHYDSPNSSYAAPQPGVKLNLNVVFLPPELTGNNEGDRSGEGRKLGTG